MKSFLYLLYRTVYFLNCVAETYSIYLPFWQIQDLTLETNCLCFPKSARPITLNKRRIQNALALVQCRSSHRCLLSQPLGDISDLAESLNGTEWRWLIGVVKRRHVMREREVRTVCALKADNKRNAPKFVEWEPVRVEVDVTCQGCWSEEMQRTTAACRCVFFSKVSLYFISSAALASFWPFVALSCAVAGLQSWLQCILSLAATCPQRGPGRGKHLSSFVFLLGPLNCCLWEFLFTLDLDSARLHELLLFFSLLIFCSYHMGVRYGQCKVNWEKQEQGFWQAFIQMEPLHWACSMGWGHLVGRKLKMGRRVIGSGRKSVHSWISELAHSSLSQSPTASQKRCLVRRTGEKRRVAVTWHKQELSYCILTKFHHYFGSIMSTVWVRELGTVLRKSTGSQNGHLQL